MSAIIQIIGNTGKEPTTDTLPNGNTVTKVSVAVNIYKGKDRESTTNWYNVAVFGKMQETMRDWRKGDTVAVSGALEERKYEKDGEKRTSLDLVADRVQNLSKFVKPRAGSESAPASAPPPAKRPAQQAPSVEDELPF